MTYGWQGNASTSWMTDDPEDASKMAGAIATQLLVWEDVYKRQRMCKAFFAVLPIGYSFDSC